MYKFRGDDRRVRKLIMEDKFVTENQLTSRAWKIKTQYRKYRWGPVTFRKDKKVQLHKRLVFEERVAWNDWMYNVPKGELKACRL